MGLGTPGSVSASVVTSVSGTVPARSTGTRTLLVSALPPSSGVFYERCEREQRERERGRGKESMCLDGIRTWTTQSAVEFADGSGSRVGRRAYQSQWGDIRKRRGWI